MLGDGEAVDSASLPPQSMVSIISLYSDTEQLWSYHWGPLLCQMGIITIIILSQYNPAGNLPSKLKNSSQKVDDTKMVYFSVSQDCCDKSVTELHKYPR